MVQKRLDILLAHDEAFWRKRSGMGWLKERDHNTLFFFFHNKATSMRKKNLIHGLPYVHGQWHTSVMGIEIVVLSYFDELFCSSSPPNAHAILDIVDA